jgi:predicted nuclease of predicted toxin-antitoxin system
VIKFVIDEDLPRSLTKILKIKGYEALDIRDHGLRSKSDEEIFEFACKESAVIVTGDMGFGNLLRFPTGSHFGIFIIHFPNEVSTPELNTQIIKALNALIEEDFRGNLIILEPGRVRIRRK